MIAQKSTFDVFRDPNKWLHSSKRREQRKTKQQQKNMAMMIWRHCDGIKLMDNVTPHYRADKDHVRNNEI